MSSTPEIKLTFSCKQDWNAMEATCNGRFCGSCKKEVFDFTGHSISEIKKIKEEKGEICGLFRREQIEPDLVPIEFNFLQKARYFTFAAATLLGLELTQAGAQERGRIKIEKSIDTCRDADKFVKETNDSSTVIAEPIQKSESKKNSRYLFTVARRTFYTSRRFPFIRILSRRTLGCPVF